MRPKRYGRREGKASGWRGRQGRDTEAGTTLVFPQNEGKPARPDHSEAWGEVKPMLAGAASGSAAFSGPSSVPSEDQGPRVFAERADEFNSFIACLGSCPPQSLALLFMHIL